MKDKHCVVMNKCIAVRRALCTPPSIRSAHAMAHATVLLPFVWGNLQGTTDWVSVILVLFLVSWTQIFIVTPVLLIIVE